ncbi:7224_t:CDS:1 [Scutellospora calospora]|uniref:7224_t:CDS:1 n=1 Tax=Scutellospora calospora TaxID=85575 RepID=A0ACA9K7E2_9GLOM|nr:7224_t:CDS:1 [Scutellospora calospora]
MSAPSSSEDNEEYDKQFVIFTNILINLSRAKYSKEKLSSINLFIRLATIKKNVYNNGYLVLGRTLNLAEYLNIIEKNESWIEYLLYLVDYGRENNGCVIFDPIELDEFCLKYFYLGLKYLSYIVDIKKIEYRDRYLYSEPKRLQYLDNLLLF